MEIDYNRLLNAMLLANLKTSDPLMAKLIRVFTKKGIPVVDAMAMLLEIGTIAQEMQERGDNNG